MKSIFRCLSLCLLISGCGGPEVVRPSRPALTLDSMGLRLGELPRGVMLSDRHGGFLAGKLARGERAADLGWTVFGREVLAGLDIACGRTPATVTSAFIEPHRLSVSCDDGSDRTITPLETLPAGLHGFSVDVRARSARMIMLTPLGRDVPLAARGRGVWQASGGFLTVEGGPHQTFSGGAVGVPDTVARFLLLYGSRGVDTGTARTIYRSIDSLETSRRERLNRLLNRAYFFSSDPRLTHALSWLRLSLDALVVLGAETSAVAGLPWDGSVGLREISHSLGGLNYALGDYAPGGAILRSLVRWQDTLASRPTYGQLPAVAGRGALQYSSPDVAPWFVREMYDHVSRSQDTALVRHFYPMVKRSIVGTQRYHADRRNLMTHTSDGTWMGTASPRGNRAAEMQLLWYFQQLVGSYMATFVGDWKSGERWGAGADSTGAGFNALFIDTTRHLVYDYLDASGAGSLEVRPNAMICLEIIGTEIDQQSTLKRILSTIVYPHGVGTLDPASSRYSPYAQGRVVTNGPVATWLSGQLAYALTRYDRQDVSYVVTSSLMNRVLDAGMAGALPEALEIVPRQGETSVRDAGRDCSLPGMAEVIRSFYQDYLGARGDATSGVLSIQPKLPEHLSEVDFTIFLGTQPVNILYRSAGGKGEIFVDAPGSTRSITLNVLWPLEGGSAWRGSLRMPAGSGMRITMDADDMRAYRGGESVDVTGKWKITTFSRRSEFGEFELARPRGKT